MDQLLQSLPKHFLGVIAVPASGIRGWLGLTKKIGVELRLGEWNHGDQNTVTCDAYGELFVVPPTLSVPHFGRFTLELTTRRVTYRTDRERLDIEGRVAKDDRRISGVANLPSFSLMDVAGDFLNMSIQLLPADEV